VRAVIQRVTKSCVTVDGEITGSIDKGLLILLGVARGDSEEDASLLAKRCITLRVFDDSNRLMNHSLSEVGGAILVISQFTLLANCRKGRRPSFTDAAPQEEATRLVDFFIQTLRQADVHVETGTFGARMEVELINDGPMTIVLDTKELRSARRSNSRKAP